MDEREGITTYIISYNSMKSENFVMSEGGWNIMVEGYSFELCVYYLFLGHRTCQNGIHLPI